MPREAWADGQRGQAAVGFGDQGAAEGFATGLEGGGAVGEGVGLDDDDVVQIALGDDGGGGGEVEAAQGGGDVGLGRGRTRPGR